MKIIVNPDNLVPNDDWQIFNKVRVIVENHEGKFAISNEGGKCIFPGGKREKGETNLEAVRRELKEETGIDIPEDEFTEVLELETLYKNFHDYRTDSFRPRYTSTIYYYVKCASDIDVDNMELEDGEIKEGFTIAFVDKEKLLELLSIDHSSATNGVFFDEENQIVIDSVLKKMFSLGKQSSKSDYHNHIDFYMNGEENASFSGEIYINHDDFCEGILFDRDENPCFVFGTFKKNQSLNLYVVNSSNEVYAYNGSKGYLKYEGNYFLNDGTLENSFSVKLRELDVDPRDCWDELPKDRFIKKVNAFRDSWLSDDAHNNLYNSLVACDSAGKKSCK